MMKLTSEEECHSNQDSEKERTRLNRNVIIVLVIVRDRMGKNRHMKWKKIESQKKEYQRRIESKHLRGGKYI